MGLFNKKEKVPQVTPKSPLPELPEPPKRSGNELPSLPHTNNYENFNRNIVKSAVTESDESLNSSGDNEVMIEELPRDFNKESLGNSDQIPKPKMEKSIMPPTKESEIPDVTSEYSPQNKKPEPTEKSPIFIRVDKFQAAQKDFEDMKKKVSEIDSVMEKINDINEKENTEIEKWVNDLNEIKSKLAEIDSMIFEKI